MAVDLSTLGRHRRAHRPPDRGRPHRRRTRRPRTTPTRAYASGELAPPVFGVVPVFDAMAAASASLIPSDYMMFIVHGEQDMHFHQPLRAGPGRCPPRHAATRVRVGGCGTRIVMQGRLGRREHGRAASSPSTSRSSCARMSDGESGGPDKPSHDFPEAARANPVGDPYVVHVDDDQTFRYRDASGDQMPIHVDEDFAKNVGLPGIIAHGLCTMAMTSQAVIQRPAAATPPGSSGSRCASPPTCSPATTSRSSSTTPAPSTVAAKAYAFEATSKGDVVVKNGWAEVEVRASARWRCCGCSPRPGRRRGPGATRVPGATVGEVLDAAVAPLRRRLRRRPRDVPACGATATTAERDDARRRRRRGRGAAAGLRRLRADARRAAAAPVRRRQRSRSRGAARRPRVGASPSSTTSSRPTSASASRGSCSSSSPSPSATSPSPRVYGAPPRWRRTSRARCWRLRKPNRPDPRLAALIAGALALAAAVSTRRIGARGPRRRRRWRLRACRRRDGRRSSPPRLARCSARSGPGGAAAGVVTAYRFEPWAAVGARAGRLGLRDRRLPRRLRRPQRVEGPIAGIAAVLVVQSRSPPSGCRPSRSATACRSPSSPPCCARPARSSARWCCRPRRAPAPGAAPPRLVAAARARRGPGSPAGSQRRPDVRPSPAARRCADVGPS